MLATLRAYIFPRRAFDLEAHVARSAEVRAFDATAWLKPRQPINMLASTCAKLRRPVGEA